jgi:hypothetical protein
VKVLLFFGLSKWITSLFLKHFLKLSGNRRENRNNSKEFTDNPKPAIQIILHKYFQQLIIHDVCQLFNMAFVNNGNTISDPNS